MAVPSGGGRKFRDRLIQNLIYSFDPVRVFRLHQDRPEAGDSLRITLDFRGGKIEEVHREGGQGEMQILPGRFGEDLPCQIRDLGDTRRSVAARLRCPIRGQRPSAIGHPISIFRTMPARRIGIGSAWRQIGRL